MLATVNVDDLTLYTRCADDPTRLTLTLSGGPCYGRVDQLAMVTHLFQPGISVSLYFGSWPTFAEYYEVVSRYIDPITIRATMEYFYNHDAQPDTPNRMFLDGDVFVTATPDKTIPLATATLDGLIYPLCPGAWLQSDGMLLFPEPPGLTVRMRLANLSPYGLCIMYGTSLPKLTAFFERSGLL